MDFEIPSDWQIAPIGQFSELVRRSVPILDSEKYRTMGVRLWGEGAYEREQKPGHEIKAAKMFAVAADDLVINRIWVQKGSCGVAGPELDGCVVTQDFPTFQLNLDVVSTGWLKYMFKARWFWQECEAKSRGTSGRQRIKTEEFTEIEIPLPPLEEQRRIVARLDGLTARIEQALALQEAATQEVEVFRTRTIDTFIERANPTFQRLADCLAEPLRNGLSLPASSLGETGVTFAKVGIVNTGVMASDEVKYADIQLEPDSPFWMKPGDVFVSRGNALNLVGRAAMYEGDPENCAFPDLLIRIRVQQEKIDPRFLVRYLQSQKARHYLEANATGTSPSMKKISQPKLERMEVPVLPLHRQREILMSLEDFETRIRALSILQSQSIAELNAFMPSALDKAFRGEL